MTRWGCLAPAILGVALLAVVALAQIALPPEPPPTVTPVPTATVCPGSDEQCAIWAERADPASEWWP